MNARLNERNILRPAKKILGLAGLASLALICAGATCAQSQPLQSESSARPLAATPATSSGMQRLSATPAIQQAVAQHLPAKPSAPRGQSESITIHGHWTIEVRNPDGKSVIHREFENALTSGGGGGANLLASFLARSTTPGSWQIELQDSTGGGNYILIDEPNSAASSNCASVLSRFNQGNVPGVNSLFCSTSLSVVGGVAGPGGVEGPTETTVTFMGSGQVPANFPSAIGYVETDSFYCAPSITPIACVNTLSSTTPNGSTENSFTARSLDGNTAAGAASGDPNPVPVTPGQTVQATVVISFSSGATSAGGSALQAPANRH
jgi:hypothetical protein